MEAGSLAQLSSDCGFSHVQVGHCEEVGMSDTWEVAVGTIAIVLGEFKGGSTFLKLMILIDDKIGWVYPDELYPV